MTHPSPRAQTLVPNEANPPFIIPEGCSSLVVPNGVGAGAPNSPEGVGQGSQGSADLAYEMELWNLGREIQEHLAEVTEINNRDPHTFADMADAAMARGKVFEKRQRLAKLVLERMEQKVARGKESA